MFMLNFYYKGFWIECDIIDQKENGYPELGVTFTSYVYWDGESRENHEDPIDDLIISYDSVEDFHSETIKAIDKFVRKNKIKR